MVDSSGLENLSYLLAELRLAAFRAPLEGDFPPGELLLNCEEPWSVFLWEDRIHLKTKI